MELHVDTFNRLSLGMMQMHSCRPDEAIKKLEALSLNLACGDEIRHSIPLQAALLTAINTGKRAFLGGVFVQLPEGTPSLLPRPGNKSLNEFVVELGATLCDDLDQQHFCLTFGLPGSIDNNQLQVVANDWQAGVLNGDIPPVFDSVGRVPTSGIFAGALAVCLAFLKTSGIQLAAADHSTGISLWRPDLHWLDETAIGPAVSILPKKYWLLGLGHLGQAYLWNIGLLPYEDTGEVTILLQDNDKLKPANWSAGLLSRMSDGGKFKTRVCSRWLEDRGFNTLVTERLFDENIKRQEEEPFLALCGFDSAAGRLPLEMAGFDLIVEAGLGGDLAGFDKLSMHSFPNAFQSPLDIWGQEREAGLEVNPVVYDLLKEITMEDCGIVPLTIAGKAVSASFVGACTGSLGISELLRGLHGGLRYDKISLHLRDLSNRQAIVNSKGVYTVELARNGFVPIKTESSL